MIDTIKIKILYNKQKINHTKPLKISLFFNVYVICRDLSIQYR